MVKPKDDRPRGEREDPNGHEPPLEAEAPAPFPAEGEAAEEPEGAAPPPGGEPGEARGVEEAEEAPPPGSAEEPGEGSAEADGEAEEGDADEEPVEGAPKRRRKRREETLPPVPPDRLDGAVEALLLASGDVLTVERLRDLLGLSSIIHVREAVERLRERWAAADLAVEIQDVAGGVRVVTRPEYAEYVRRLSRRQEGDRLTPTLLETLSVVAYRQPVPRVEVERIRGVQCGEALRALLERRIVKVVGRSDQPGRPLLYGTTRRFLEVFGLGSLKDLPAKGDLKRL